MLTNSNAGSGSACLVFFMDDLNHHEWLYSTTTTRHGVAGLDFATVSGCDQLVTDSTHARGGTLDLLMTDLPDLVYGWLL